MKFKPGQSGNPKGRRPGSRNKATALRAQLEKHGPAVIETITNAALKGDLQACRLVLDRIVAPLRPVDSPVTAATGDTGTLADVAKSVIAEAVMGRVSPAAARELASAISSAARAKQIDELEARLAALEKRYENTNQEAGNGAWR